jgi:membrane protein insertase Oxa1/YidC/SpoIIIJ
MQKISMDSGLAQPDILLGLFVGLHTVGMTELAPSLQSNTKLMMPVLPSIITFVIASQLSSGIALYWAASNAVSPIQTLILRRISKNPGPI